MPYFLRLPPRRLAPDSSAEPVTVGTPVTAPELPETRNDSSPSAGAVPTGPGDMVVEAPGHGGTREVVQLRVFPVPAYELITRRERATEVCASLAVSPLLAVDTETYAATAAPAGTTHSTL